MRKITNEEIRALKRIIRDQRQTISSLKAENTSLKAQLEESRAKEGKGCLETALECITDVMKELTEPLADAFNAYTFMDNADCENNPDCDFNCESCDMTKLEIDEDGDDHGI